MRTRTWETLTQWPWFFPSVFSDNFAEGEELNSRFTEITRGFCIFAGNNERSCWENQELTTCSKGLFEVRHLNFVMVA